MDSVKSADNLAITPDASAPKYGRTAYILSVGGLGVFFASCWFYWFRLSDGTFSNNGKDWGDFGAFIGGFAGPAISVVTLIALAYTMRIQAEDLSKARGFMRDQSATMAQQAFDSVFFNLLMRFSNVRDDVTIEYREIRKDIDGEMELVFLKATGRKAFEQFYKALQGSIGPEGDQPNRRALLEKVFKSFYELSESDLGPYFRTLYHIFKYVNSGPRLTRQQKINYANIARAQLSDVELCVLFYDGLTDLALKFKPLIEYYGVLKHVNAKHLLNSADKADRAMYQRSAFQSQEEREATTSDA